MSRKAKGPAFKMRSGNDISFKEMGSSPVKFDWNAYFSGKPQAISRADRQSNFNTQYNKRIKRFAADPEHARYQAEKLGGSHLAAWETQQKRKFGKNWVKPKFEGVKSFENKIKHGKYTRGTPYEKYHMQALGITDWSQLD